MAVIKLNEHRKKFETLQKNELLGNFLSYYHDWKQDKLHYSQLIEFTEIVERLDSLTIHTPQFKKFLDEVRIKLKGI